MDWFTVDTRRESPWTVVFVEDNTIVGESKEQVEVRLEGWKIVLEGVMNVSVVGARRCMYVCS